MFAQELMKNILEGLTTLFNSVPTAINTVGQADYPAIKAGNAIGGLVSAGANLLGPLVNSVINMVPSMLDIGDRLTDLTMYNPTVNSAYHSVNVSGNLPLIVGDGPGNYGMTHLLKAMINVGVDGTTSYVGDPTVSVNLISGLYSMIAKILSAMGEVMMTDLPNMFPWG